MKLIRKISQFIKSIPSRLLTRNESYVPYNHPSLIRWKCVEITGRARTCKVNAAEYGIKPTFLNINKDIIVSIEPKDEARVSLMKTAKDFQSFVKLGRKRVFDTYEQAKGFGEENYADFEMMSV